MTTRSQQVSGLLTEGLTAASSVVEERLSRSVRVASSAAPDSSSLLRFDVRFGELGNLSWLISNEDATGFSDMLIGGEGDRGATLTEMHLDALSSAFSEMLERAVVGINGQLAEPVEPGGIDMNMEPRLPTPEPGDVQSQLALEIEGFGPLVVVQLADEAMVETLAGRLGASAEPAAGQDAAEQQPASGEPPAGQAAAEAASPAGPDNVVDLGAAARQDGRPRDLSMLFNVPLNVTVELGRTQRSVQELLEFNVGSILELGKLAGDPMDILVNGKVLARGEVVVIDEEFGIRITEILSPEQRLRGIG